jgi:hypothetical protein
MPEESGFDSCPPQEAHPASYPMGTRGSCPGGKEARPWRWPSTSSLSRGLSMRAAWSYPPPTMLSWRRDNLYLWFMHPHQTFWSVRRNTSDILSSCCINIHSSTHGANQSRTERCDDWCSHINLGTRVTSQATFADPWTQGHRWSAQLTATAPPPSWALRHLNVRNPMP